MARIRSIKPVVAKHSDLFDLEKATGFPMRFAWCVLWTHCDREGRFKWKPRDMKPEILPHDALDFTDVMNAFLDGGFVVKYRVGAEWFGVIPTFAKHQVVNNRESDSVLPGLDAAEEVIAFDATSSTRESRVAHASKGEGKGREGKGREQEGNGTLRTSSADALPLEPKPARVTPDDVVDLWNRTVTRPIPTVTKLTADRRSKLEKRLKDYPDIETWRTVIAWVNEQDWCRAPGRGDHPNWTATLDWLCKSESTIAKALERIAAGNPQRQGPPRSADSPVKDYPRIQFPKAAAK